jgi:hypothetical protein
MAIHSPANCEFDWKNKHANERKPALVDPHIMNPVEPTDFSVEAMTPIATANEIQHGGDHYKSKAIQPWDYIVSNELGFLEGNAVKYLSRWREKNGIEDLQKAKHYIDKLIEVEIAKQPR